MLPLKEAIAEKHSLAEKMTFNQRMFKGELSNEEYILYLSLFISEYTYVYRYIC
jgi:heme oxygenase